MRIRFGRLTHSQIVATVFALTWATCPFIFAQERARQEVKRVTREVVSRIVPAEGVDALVDQILNVPAIITRSATARGDDVLTLVRPEGTYTFEGMTYDQSTPDATPVFSGSITLLNMSGNQNTYDLTSLTVIDHNRIDYTITSSVAGLQEEEVGTLVGIDTGRAIHSVSKNGQNTAARILNFTNITNSGQGVTAAAQCEPVYYEGGGASAASAGAIVSSDGWGTVAVEPCTVLAVVVVVVVFIIICYLFCWLL